MDRRSVLAIVLCFIIFVGWQKLYLEPRQNHYVEPIAQTGTVRAGDAKNPAAALDTASTAVKMEVPTDKKSASAPKTIAEPNQTVSLETGTGTAKIGNGSDFFVGWNLKSYKIGISQEAAAVDFSSVTNVGGQTELLFDDPKFSYLNGVAGVLTKTPSGVIWNYEDDKVRMTREFSSSATQPWIDLKVTAEFKSTRPNYAFLTVSSKSPDKDPESRDRQLIYWSNGSLDRIVTEKADIKQTELPVKYVGSSNRYFLMALVAQGDSEPRGVIQPLGDRTARASMRYQMNGNMISIPVRAYFGPKEVELLRTVEPTLNHAVDFGWFEVIAYPLLMGLKWIDQFVKNYGVAIILLTVLLKLATYPLTYKSMKSMREMAKLQPQLAKLREKYKDDRESLNREMMVMMKSHGYNPVAGCLPMLIQMPVFFALYRVLYSSIELYQAPFALWIQDLSRPDHLYVTPVLLAATMFLQQKVTPNTATDPAQQKMMQFMPLIFGVFMISLPAGLTLYMLVNTLAGVVQQMILNNKLGPMRSVPAT